MQNSNAIEDKAVDFESAESLTIYFKDGWNYLTSFNTPDGKRIIILRRNIK